MSAWTPEQERAIAAVMGGWWIAMTALEVVLGI